MRRPQPFSLLAVATLALAAGACSSEEPSPVGDGLFRAGCPVPGRSFARVLASADERPSGPAALAAPGDLLLANEKAAFVVTKPGEARTYYYYGGILVDAVAVDGCAQASPERFGELAPLMGRLDVGDFAQSVMRAFKGERAEILDDGTSGRAAVVRVHGSDDLHWLVEMELQRSAAEDGRPKATSTPLGVKLAIDYVLEPGSSVLQVVVRLTNTTKTRQSLLAGAALFLGDTTPIADPAYHESRLELGGFRLGFGLPWLAAGNGDGSHAIAIDSMRMGTTTIAGVSAIIDVAQALDAPLLLAPAGEAGDTQSVRFFVGAGPTDRNSATQGVAALKPGGRDSDLVPIRGRVRESDGTPLADVAIDLQRRTGSGDFATLDQLRTNADGTFAGLLPDFGDGKPWRLAPRLEGHPAPSPVDLVLPDEAGPFELTLEPAGKVGYEIVDEAGKPLPAKITLFRRTGDTEAFARRLFTIGGYGEAAVQPGEYRAVVTRGYEYEIVELPLVVNARQSTPLEATLRRLVDTTGFLSVDGHVHQGPSEDSTVGLPTRMDSVAASGLEVMVATDHEVIEDLARAPDALRLAQHLAVVNGQEVTATSPEHTNMWGVPARPDLVRGGPVRWYGKDLEGIYAAERERGARIITLNHPREHGSCSWLCLIDWDRITGEPRVEDPRAFGLAPDAKLWSWNFDAVELLNGMKDVFVREDPRRSGKFDDWMAFLNLGHRITAVGVTDEHGEDGVGSPRTWFEAPTDEPGEFDVEMLEDAVKAGRAVISAGAFARVQVGGKGLGETATASGGEVDVALRVEAIPQIDVSVVKVFVNCDEVLTLPATAPDAVVKLETAVKLPVDRDAHVVVVGFGEKPMPETFVPVLRATPRFVTNPVYVDADGDGRFTPPGGKSCRYTALR